MLKFSTLAGFLLLPLLAIGQAPTITAVSPAANARAAAAAGPVTVSFSQPLTAGSAAALKVYSAQRGGLRTRGATPAVVSGSTLSFSPTTSAFLPGETVTSTITTAATGSGGSLANARVMQFTVATGGTGKGNFTAVPDLVAESSLRDVTMGDVDGDGDLDLVTANADGSYAAVNVRLNNGAGTFGTNQELLVPVNDSPRGLALGDVDGDGDLDIAAANYIGGTISIWLNNGAGIFGNLQRIIARTGTMRVAFADLDKDGDLDLLAANYLAESVTVHLNNGVGAFPGPYQNVDVGDSPAALAVGDLDNDGDLDFVTASSHAYYNSVSVRLNNGAAAFTTYQEVRVGTQPSSLALGDLDGDGDLDLLAANTSSNTVSTCLNDGTGWFRGSQYVPVGQGPSTVAMGDLDSDGDLDFVTANFNAGTLSVCYNDGTSLFGRAQTVQLSSNTGGMTLNDLDGDGDLDAVVANGIGNRLRIRFNNPYPAPGLLPAISRFAPDSAAAGTTVAVTGTKLSGLSAFSLHGVVVPLASISSNTDTGFHFVVPAGATTAGPYTLTAAAGTSTSTSTSTDLIVRLRATTLSPIPNSTAAPALNSTLDLTFTEPVTAASAATLKVYSAQAGGRKTGVTTLSGSTLHFVAAPGTPYTHFRSGETVSVSVPNTVRSSQGLRAGRRVAQFTVATGGTGRGTFQAGSTPVVPNGPFKVALGDLDGDGDLDMVTVNPGLYSGNFAYMASIRLNGGDATGSNTGAFSGGTDFLTLGIPLSLVLGDIDGDGDLDMVIGHSNYSSAVYRNSGNSAAIFGAISQVVAEPNADEMTLGDVDGDGDLDLVSVSFNERQISVRLNGNDASGSNTGVFGSRQTFSDRGPTRVRLADVDGDGDLDLITTNASTAFYVTTVGIRLNGGDASGSNTGVFSNGSTTEVGYTPVGLAVGDVDGDGDLDLVTANDYLNKVSILLNGANASGSNSGIFTKTTELSVGATPHDVALADLDADGDLDILVANRGANTLGYYFNNGQGSFSNYQTTAVGAKPTALAVGDIDGDGDVDVLIANHDSNQVSVRLNGPASPLAAQPSAGAVGFTLAPNPTHGAIQIAGVPPGQVVYLYDTLGREITQATAETTGTTYMQLPASLATGVYIVRAGLQAQRLVVE